MGGITLLSEKLRAVPLQVVSDEQAQAAIAEIAGSSGDPARSLDEVQARGLLSLTVPSDFGGADVPNALVADLVTAVARRSDVAALALISHFVALERVRTSGTEEQRRGIYHRVLAGERVVHAGFDTEDVDCRPEGIGLAVTIPTAGTPEVGRHWALFAGVEPSGQRGLALVARPVSSGAGEDVHIPRDQFLSLRTESDALAVALQSLLQGARVLAHLSDIADPLPDSPSPTLSGAILIELLHAMVSRLAHAIDGLQVGAVTASLDGLAISASALDALIRAAHATGAAPGNRG